VRLFAALETPAEIREKLSELVKALRAVDTRPKWVRMQNLHVTLKFIGEVPEAKLGEIREALAEVKMDQAVEFTFRGLGFFPQEKSPRVLWVGIIASPNLQDLAKEIELRLEKVKVPRDTREFSPHLTLARFEAEGLSEKLRSAIAAHAREEFGSHRTNQFHLVESKLNPAGAEYTALESFTFAAEA
jgi:RNA 2',3'-cyclic 3'-phosphodiesterase